MSDYVENRAYPRFEILVQVQVTRESEIYVMSIKNISRGGAFILGEPAEYPDLQVNTKVELVIFNADDPYAAAVTLNAMVIRIDKKPSPGFGLQFIDVNMESKTELVEFLESIPSDSGQKRRA